MLAFKLVLWGFLAILGAASLAFVTCLVNLNKKVTGLWLVVVGCIYVLAYRFYGPCGRTRIAGYLNWSERALYTRRRVCRHLACPRTTLSP